MTKLLISSMYIESSSFFIRPVISESSADLIIGLDVSEFLQLAVYNVWRGMELKMKTSMARFDQQNCNNNKSKYWVSRRSSLATRVPTTKNTHENWKNSEACEKTMSIATRNSITYDRAWHTWQNMTERHTANASQHPLRDLWICPPVVTTLRHWQIHDSLCQRRDLALHPKH